MCDLEAIGLPSIFRTIRNSAALVRMLPTLDLVGRQSTLDGTTGEVFIFFYLFAYLLVGDREGLCLIFPLLYVVMGMVLLWDTLDKHTLHVYTLKYTNPIHSFCRQGSMVFKDDTKHLPRTMVQVHFPIPVQRCLL